VCVCVCVFSSSTKLSGQDIAPVKLKLMPQ